MRSTRKKRDRDIIQHFIDSKSHKHLNPKKRLVEDEGDSDGDENDDKLTMKDFEDVFVNNHLSVMLNTAMALARERNLRDFGIV